MTQAVQAAGVSALPGALLPTWTEKKLPEVQEALIVWCPAISAIIMGSMRRVMGGKPHEAHT